MTNVQTAPTASHVSNSADDNDNSFITVETVHRAQVTYHWSDRKLHDMDYHIQVWDAVDKVMTEAKVKYGVQQNQGFCCQWEGVEIEGDDLDAVKGAAKHVARALARFKEVLPLPFNVVQPD